MAYYRLSTLDDLLALIGTSEDEHIEFKSSMQLSPPKTDNDARSFLDSLSCDISGFLNGSGGTLVLGIEEHNNQRDRDTYGTAARLSSGVPRDRWDVSKLESALAGRIQPNVADRLKVRAIKVDKEANLYAFVVDVSAGVTAYQARDRKYYARRSTGLEPLEDKEVRLRMLFNDRPRVDIKIEPRFQSSPTLLTKLDERLILKVTVYLENIGTSTVREGSVGLTFFSGEEKLDWRISGIGSFEDLRIYPGMSVATNEYTYGFSGWDLARTKDITIRAAAHIDNGRETIQQFSLNELLDIETVGLIEKLKAANDALKRRREEH